MRKKLVLIFSMLLFLGLSSNAFAIPFGGVEFPDGAISFADSVYSYIPGTNVGPGYDDPLAAIGTPDYSGANNTSVSLGIGGSLILQFTDNSLTTSGDATADLHVFEIGGVTEWMNIAISTDAINWIDLGGLLGQPTSIDIDSYAGVTQGTSYSYVRINDIAPNQSGFPYGEADIDAVGAISSAPPVDPVPEPATMVLFGIGLLGLAGVSRRKK